MLNPLGLSGEPYILELFQTSPKEAFRLLFDAYHMKLCIYAVQLTDSFEMAEDIGRTRQTLWRAVQMLTQKLSCQTIHDCPKVVPLHYESEWQ